MAGTSDLRFLIASRPHQEIRDILAGFPNADMASFSNVHQDVEILIAEKVAWLTKRKPGYTDALQQRVTDILKDKAEGTFLYVGLACAELGRNLAQDAIALLEALPAGLTAMYGSLLGRAVEEARQKGKPPEVVIGVLRTVSVALRPLTVSELSIACSLHEEQNSEERERFTRETIELCRLMVVVDKKYVRLLHKSVKDFLFRSTMASFPSLSEAHAQLSYSCVDRLIEDFEHQTTGKPFKSRNPFLEYSTRFWGEHARFAGDRFAVQARQRQFFTPISKSRDTWSTAALALGEQIPFDVSLFHVAAHWGIYPLLCHAESCIVLDGPKDGHRSACEELSTRFSGFRGNPLELAAKASHLFLFCWLLSFGVKQVHGKLTLSKTCGTSSDAGVSEKKMDYYSFPVSRDVVKAVVQSRTAGPNLLRALIRLRGRKHLLEEDILAEVAQNENGGRRILAILIETYGDDVWLSEEVMAYVVSNSGFDNPFIEHLFQRYTMRTSTTMGHLAEHRKDFFIDPILWRQVHSLELIEDSVLSNTNEDSGEQQVSETASGLVGVTNIDDTADHILEDAVQDTLFGYQRVQWLLMGCPDTRIPGHMLWQAAGNHVLGKQIIEELLCHTVVGKVNMSKILRLAAASASDVYGIVETVLRHYPDRVHYVGRKALLTLVDKCTLFIDSAFCKIARETMILLLTSNEISLSTPEAVIEAVATTKTPEEHLISWLRGRQIPRLRGRELCWAKCVNNFSSDTLQALVDLADDEQAALDGLIEHIVKCDRRSLLHVFVLDRSDITPQTTAFVSALQAAVMYGEKAVLQVLIDRGAEVRSTRGIGNPVMGMAVQRGDKEIVKMLLDAGAEVHVRDEAGNFPLGYTLQIDQECENYVAIAKILLKQGADPNSPTSELYGNVLIEAMMTRNYQIGEMLLEHGAELNVRTGYYGHVLQAAASANVPFDIMDRLLLAKGADINAQGGRHGNALSAALWDDRLQLAYLLSRNGAKLTPESVRDQLTRTNPPLTESTFCFILRLIDDVQISDKKLGQQLRASAEICLPTIVRIYSTQGGLSFCQTLHNSGARISASDWAGRTALHEASAAGSVATAQWLIRVGATVDATDTFGCTALHYAVQESLEMVKVLLAVGANIRALDGSGSTVLHRASSSERYTIVEHLVEELVVVQQTIGPEDFASTIINHANDSQVTALELAMLNTTDLTLKFLQANGALRGNPQRKSVRVQTRAFIANTSNRTLPQQTVLSHQTASRLLEHKQAEISAAIYNVIKRSSRTKVSNCYALARLLVLTLQHADAVTVWEQMVQPLRNTFNVFSHPDIACRGCNQTSITGVRYWCTKCLCYDLCACCWLNRQSGENDDDCTHSPDDYVRIPRPSWRKGSDIINDRGETREDWAERLYRLFGFSRTNGATATLAACLPPEDA